MGLGRARAWATVLMVVAMLAGGLWTPAQAQEDVQTGATPVAPVDPGTPDNEGDAGTVPQPAKVSPANVQAQDVAEDLSVTVVASNDNPEAGGTVTYTITAEGMTAASEVLLENWAAYRFSSIANLSCTIDVGSNGTVPCASRIGGVVRATVQPDTDGSFRFTVSYTATLYPGAWDEIENEACLTGANAETICDSAVVVTQPVAFASVTIRAILPDGATFPLSGEICVWDRINSVQCMQGANAVTFGVGSSYFNYWINAYGYGSADGSDEIAEGEVTTIDVELQPQVFNITKTVSNPNPAPGDEITFTVHAWGTSPSGFVHFSDDLPWELTDITVSCDFVAGAPDWPETCDDWSSEEGGWFGGSFVTEEDGTFDVTILVTATVPDREDWSAVNTACVEEGGREVFAARAAADPIIGSDCASVSFLTLGAEIAAWVTVNVTTADGSPVPAGTTICVGSPYNPVPACSKAGVSRAMFPLAAGDVVYSVAAPGYAPVSGFDVVEPGDDKEINVVLEPELEADMHITKTVSDPNPEPGAQVSYEIHVWGTTGSFGPIENLDRGTTIQIVDFLPAELRNARVSCEVITGKAGDPSCAAPIDGVINGSIYPKYDGETETASYEAVITVTGTVPNEQGVTFTNVACAIPGMDVRPVRMQQPAARTGVQGFAQEIPLDSLPGGCAEATVTTQSDPEPEIGQWGTATMTVDVTEARPGDEVTYTLTLPWEAAAPQVMRHGVMGFAQIAGPNFVIIDTVPQQLTNVSWTCAAENATCSPALGSGSDVTAEGEVLDPAQDALITLTITGTVRDDAPEGEVVNRACVTQEGEPECLQSPEASFVVLAQAVTPTPSPTPSPTATPVGPTATPSPTGTPAPATPTPGATATATPGVTGLPSTGAAPGGGMSMPMLLALAAMLLGAGALTLRGARLRR